MLLKSLSSQYFKKSLRKEGSSKNQFIFKAPKASVQAKNDLAARERRRKDIAAQEKEYQDYMKKLHNERWEKQQVLYKWFAFEYAKYCVSNSFNSQKYIYSTGLG